MNKKKHAIIIILIIICIFIYLSRFKLYKFLYDDILILAQTSSIIDENNENTKLEKKDNDITKYIFDIKCKDTKLKAVNLSDTIKKETLVNEKIAPGLEGKFSIIINANQDTKYKILFESVNSKPQNLKFVYEESKKTVQNLEDFKELLAGNLRKNETRVITIYWYWEYENTREGNIQDTTDSKNIQNYQFKILALGEQIL